MVYWALKYFNRFDASIIKSFPKIVAYVADMHTLNGVATAEALYDEIPLLPPFAAWMNDHPHKGSDEISKPAKKSVQQSSPPRKTERVLPPPASPSEDEEIPPTPPEPVESDLEASIKIEMDMVPPIVGKTPVSASPFADKSSHELETSPTAA